MGRNRLVTRDVRQPVSLCISGLKVRTKRWIEVEGRFAIGEGGGELLQALDAHGSLAEAARRVGWSYRHAWGYVQRSERVLGVPLVIVRHGRGATKGSVLTTEARAVITILLQETHTS